MTIREKEREQLETLEAIYLEYRNFMLSIARSYIDDPQYVKIFFIMPLFPLFAIRNG